MSQLGMDKKKFQILLLIFVSILLTQLSERYFPFIEYDKYRIETWWVPYVFCISWILPLFFRMKVDWRRNEVSIWDMSYFLIALVSGFAIAQSWSAGWGLSLGVSMSVVLAVLSLATTVHHSYTVRAHNRLQVRPHFILDSTFNSTTKDGYQTYTLSLKNVGLGPGIVQKYAVEISKVTIENSDQVFVEFLKLVNAKVPTKGKAEVGAVYLSAGEALDKGSEKVLFQVSIPTENRSFMEGRKIAQKIAENLELKISYACHYGMEFDVARKKTNMAELDK